jgi:hypothetical protein
MKIKNLTPHALKIQRIDGSFLELPKPEAGTLIPRRIAASVQCDPIEGVVENLPEIEEGTIYVVSRMVIDGVSDRTDLFAPGELLRDGNGNIIGAKGLAR